MSKHMGYRLLMLVLLGGAGWLYWETRSPVAAIIVLLVVGTPLFLFGRSVVRVRAREQAVWDHFWQHLEGGRFDPEATTAMGVGTVGNEEYVLETQVSEDGIQLDWFRAKGLRPVWIPWSCISRMDIVPSGRLARRMGMTKLLAELTFVDHTASWASIPWLDAFDAEIPPSVSRESRDAVSTPGARDAQDPPGLR